MVISERALALLLGLSALIAPAASPLRAQSPALALPGVEEGTAVFRALALAYRDERTQAVVTIPPPTGSASAVADVIAGRAEFARINRPLHPHEREAGLRDIELFDLPVLVLVHGGVARKSFTLTEIEAIRDGSLRNWRGLGGPDLAIRFVMLRDTGEDRPGQGSSGRTDFLRSRDIEALVRRVPGAIGLVPAPAFDDADISERLVAGRSIREPGYLLQSRSRLVFRDDRLSAEGRAFLAFLQGPRARSVAAGHRARWVP